jgi:hypothetical protein
MQSPISREDGQQTGSENLPSAPIQVPQPEVFAQK